MGKPVFNLIMEKPKEDDNNNLQNDEQEKQSITGLNNLLNNRKMENTISYTPVVYMYKPNPVTESIIDTKLNELSKIIEKNLVLLEEEYIRQALNPSIFNGITSIGQIEHILEIVNYNSSFINYIISKKLDLINIQDEDFVLLIVQYMKVVLYDIINNTFNPDNFYASIKKLYNIYSYDIEGNYIVDREVEEQPKQKILISDDINFENPILEKDTRLMVVDVINKIISEEIVKYRDQINEVTESLQNVKDSIGDTKKAINSNKK